MVRRIEESELFPLEFNGKMYQEEDCDDVFCAFTHVKRR